MTTDTQIQSYAAILAGLPDRDLDAYRAHQQHPEGLDDETLADLIHASIRTTTGARNRLVAAGLLVDNGKRVTGRYGKPVIVWQVGQGDMAWLATLAARKELVRRLRKALYQNTSSAGWLEVSLRTLVP